LAVELSADVPTFRAIKGSDCALGGRADSTIGIGSRALLAWRRRLSLWEDRNKASPQRIPAFSRSSRRTPGGVTERKGANLSFTSHSPHYRFHTRGGFRHHRARLCQGCGTSAWSRSCGRE